MVCNLEYVSIGCNRLTQVLSWSKTGLVAYGAHKSVVIYQPETNSSAGEVDCILNGHKDQVLCVQWLDHKDDLELISGSSDKNIILWQKHNGKWKKKQELTGHTNAVRSLASVVYNDDTYIASAGSDSTLKLWKREQSGDFQCIQNITFGNGFAHTLALTNLPHSKGIILACGCDDTSIKIYTLESVLLVHVLSLSGHEDWVRCLAFTNTASENDVLLASGSQDMYIRLWRISSSIKSINIEDDLSLKVQSFDSNNEKFTVVLESVLIGHEGWVFGVSWSPSYITTPALLSTSMDKTTIVWEYDESNQVWIDMARMGDVGGNTLGYYGCAFGPDGKYIIAHGYQGAFRMWKKEKETSNWKAVITISGHFGEIEDFDWEPKGRFAVTASTDQTTRLYAPWKREGYRTTWHEIARPQVHGHDMKCIAMLGRYRYASGAQEKVIRIFAAPRAFYDSFSHIANVEEEQEVLQSLPLGATVPVLGLSNKAVYEGDIQSWDDQNTKTSQPMKASAFANEDPAPFNPTLINTPPIEDVLLQNTLWPEIQKLYGHGFELFTIAASPDGSILASACKASKAEYANILIWDSATWNQKASLHAHSLTITQLCFSHSGKYLLSVSRDRTWALHRRNAHNTLEFSLVQKTDKKSSVHTRIIWSCDWFHDDSHFVTASRDKNVIVWGCNENAQCWSAKGDKLDVGESATAVSVANKKTSLGKYIVAIGIESGGIFIYTWCDDPSSNWSCLHQVEDSMCPTLTIKRLRWRPDEEESDERSLGVCSSDHSFRILKFSSSLFT